MSPGSFKIQCSMRFLCHFLFHFSNRAIVLISSEESKFPSWFCNGKSDKILIAENVFSIVDEHSRKNVNFLGFFHHFFRNKNKVEITFGNAQWRSNTRGGHETILPIFFFFFAKYNVENKADFPGSNYFFHLCQKTH